MLKNLEPDIPTLLSGNVYELSVTFISFIEEYHNFLSKVACVCVCVRACMRVRTATYLPTVLPPSLPSFQEITHLL
jgi:hypothetical protein